MVETFKESGSGRVSFGYGDVDGSSGDTLTRGFGGPFVLDAEEVVRVGVDTDPRGSLVVS